MCNEIKNLFDLNANVFIFSKYIFFFLTIHFVLLDQVPQGLDHPQGHLLFQDQDLGLTQGV